MGDAERRAYLLRGQWYGRGHSDQPEVLTAVEAWRRRADPYVFYSVSWWGGFTGRLSGVSFCGGARHGLWRDHGREQEAYLEADELVLAFEMLPGEEAGDGPPPNDSDE